MEVSFVRQRGRRDRVYVHRTDGSEASWVFPTYGDILPHDLVHLIVEAAFGLRRGFWGLVDAGIDPARVNAEASRRGGPDKYNGFAPDRTEILLAEALANARWSDATADVRHRRAVIVESCERFGVSVPANLADETIEQVQRVLGDLADRWRTLSDRTAVTLRFDSTDPERGFQSLR